MLPDFNIGGQSLSRVADTRSRSLRPQNDGLKQRNAQLERLNHMLMTVSFGAFLLSPCDSTRHPALAHRCTSSRRCACRPAPPRPRSCRPRVSSCSSPCRRSRSSRPLASSCTPCRPAPRPPWRCEGPPPLHSPMCESLRGYSWSCFVCFPLPTQLRWPFLLHPQVAARMLPPNPQDAPQRLAPAAIVAAPLPEPAPVEQPPVVFAPVEPLPPVQPVQPLPPAKAMVRARRTSLRFAHYDRSSSSHTTPPSGVPLGESSRTK